MKSKELIAIEHRIQALPANETEEETAYEILADISRLEDPKEAVAALSLFTCTLIERFL